MSRRPSSRLNVESLEARDLPAPIAVGGVVRDAISARGETDVLSFSAAAGQTFLVTANGSGASGFRPQVDVFAPGGTSPTLSLFAGGDRGFDIPTSGTWTLRVHDDDRTQTGSYAVGLERVTPRSPDFKPLTVGGRVGGSIDGTLERDQWTFDTAAGQIFQLVHTSTARQAGYQARLRLFDPDGNLFGGRSFAAGEQLEFTVQSGRGGQWVVQIEDDDRAQTGTYQIGLERLSPRSPDFKRLVVGERAAGSIAAAIEKDQFTFEAVAGEVYQIVHTSTPGPGQTGFQARRRVIDPAGNLFGGRTFAANENVEFTIQTGQTGQWIVQMEDDDRTQTGSYQIGLERIAPASPDAGRLVVGGSVSGSIAAAIEKDQFTFDTAVGQTYRIVHSSTAGPNQAGFQARIRVLNPHGELFGGRTFAAGEVITLTVPPGDGGRWVVQLEDNDLTQTGGYTVQLNRLS